MAGDCYEHIGRSYQVNLLKIVMSYRTNLSNLRMRIGLLWAETALHMFRRRVQVVPTEIGKLEH